MSDHHPDIPSDSSPEGLALIHPYARPFLFLGKEGVKRNFIWLPLIGMLLMIVLGYFYPPKHPAPWDFFGSWALIGFTAYTIVVLSAEPLFRLLARPENYYAEGEAPIIDPAALEAGQAEPTPPTPVLAPKKGEASDV